MLHLFSVLYTLLQCLVGSVKCPLLMLCSYDCRRNKTDADSSMLGLVVVCYNFMQNGTVVIPDVLQPYMDNQKVISKPASPIQVTFSSLKKQRTTEKGLMLMDRAALLITICGCSY